MTVAEITFAVILAVLVISVKSASFGQSCELSTDCTDAFTECDRSGKCACLDGFGRDGGQCIARVYSCPYGEPKKSSGRPEKCIRVPKIAECKTEPCPFNPTIVWNDTCGQGHFCYGYGLNFEVGHCCAEVNTDCPVGKAHATGTCQPLVVTNATSLCPMDTHYCHIFSPGGMPMLQKSMCCPRPCKETDFFKDGKCYELVPTIEASCEITEQCRLTGSQCVNGKCTCEKGTILDPQTGRCARPFCPSGGSPVPAVHDFNGDVINCNISSTCGGKKYCNLQLSVCCPTPDAYCPGDLAKKLAAPVKCNPRNRPGSPEGGCPEREFCFMFYAPKEFDTVEGVCCSTDILAPQIQTSDEASRNVMF